MADELPTMRVIDKENGNEVIINQSDYDAEKYDMVVEDEPVVEDESPEKPAEG